MHKKTRDARPKKHGQKYRMASGTQESIINQLFYLSHWQAEDQQHRRASTSSVCVIIQAMTRLKSQTNKTQVNHVKGISLTSDNYP